MDAKPDPKLALFWLFLEVLLEFRGNPRFSGSSHCSMCAPLHLSSEIGEFGNSVRTFEC
jgi:hypothetical protein